MRLVTVRNYSGICKGICSFDLVYNLLTQHFPLKSLVFVVHFLNAFWHGKETFSKSSSQHEIVPLVIVFHLPYSKYKGVKNVFTRVVIKIKIFHSCGTRVVRVALVLHLCHIHVSSVAHVLHSCRRCGTRVVNQTRSS